MSNTQAYRFLNEANTLLTIIDHLVFKECYSNAESLKFQSEMVDDAKCISNYSHIYDEVGSGHGNGTGAGLYSGC